MSEGAADSLEVSASPNSARLITAGSLLRAAREREGLHIAALAVSMKVPVKKLEALEADRLDLLPDAVFVRALAGSVCRALKIDSAPVLQLLPASSPPRLNSDDRGINTPFDVPGQASNGSLKNLLLTPPALMVAGLMAAAVGIYFYPEASKDTIVIDKLQAVPPFVPEVVPSAPDLSLPTTSTTASSTENVPAKATVPVSASVAATVVQTSSGSMAQMSVPAVVAPRSAEAPTPASSNAGTPPPPANLLLFKAKGTAWVQVTDAKGIQLLSRTLQPGEAVGISGALPLAVVVGRVDLTSVEMRGKPYDLSVIAQNNVARFEVKQ